MKPRKVRATCTLKDDLIKWDAEFRKFHQNAPGEFAPDDLSRKPNVIKDFGVLLISKFPEYPEQLLKCFARARTHFRKRYIKDALKFKETFRSKRKKSEYVYAKAEESGKRNAAKPALAGVQKKKTQVKRW